LEQGYPRYRADQIFSWIYQKHLRTPEGMRNLPATLRERIATTYDLQIPGVATAHASRDGMTHKFVIELEDGARVECVSMRTERRLTFCLSSQAGCALGCTFCATGLMGLKRNLKAHEIVGQVLRMGDFHEWKDPRFNLVFMGMGEPLANYEPVVAAIRIFHDERGLNLGARHITVSTSGVIPGILRLAEEGLPVGLALSLHATDDALRSARSVNKRWPIAELVEAPAYGERADGGSRSVHAARWGQRSPQTWGRSPRLHARCPADQPDPIQPGPWLRGSVLRAKRGRAPPTGSIRRPRRWSVTPWAARPAACG
jgi:23S rRNA (adenine2503-C2)-methyltransferase